MVSQQKTGREEDVVPSDVFTLRIDILKVHETFMRY